MTPNPQKYNSLYDEAKAGLNSLFQQGAWVALGWVVLLILTGGNPPGILISLFFFGGGGLVAWSEYKRLTEDEKVKVESDHYFEGFTTEPTEKTTNIKLESELSSRQSSEEGGILLPRDKRVILDALKKINRQLRMPNARADESMLKLVQLAFVIYLRHPEAFNEKNSQLRIDGTRADEAMSKLSKQALILYMVLYLEYPEVFNQIERNSTDSLFTFSPDISKRIVINIGRARGISESAIQKILEADTDDFITLLELAGLDIEKDLEKEFSRVNLFG